MHIQPRPSWPPFAPQALRQEPGVAGQIGEWLLTRPSTMWLLRRVPRALRLRGTRLVTRYDDVREALSRPDVFQVPWAEKMQLLSPSTRPFVLATDDAAAHRCAQRPLMQVFRREDVPRAACIAARSANHIVDGADGEIDALKDLISVVSRDVYRDYYGLHPLDHDLIPWLLAISNYTFRKVGPDPVAKDPAVAGAMRLTAAVNDAIAQVPLEPSSDTIAARLVQLQERCPGDLPDDCLRSMLIGTVMGFAPVFITAAAHILDVLLRDRLAMAATRQAARSGDDEALALCLLEALRFRPINAGLWRVCARDYTIAAGTRRATRIRQGEPVLVFLQAAMQDAERVRNPRRFDPSRPPSDSMVFGYGMHWCLGAPLARSLLVQSLRPLLARGFRRAPFGRSRIRCLGALPESMSLLLEPR